jgi:hypothetical protein
MKGKYILIFYVVPVLVMLVCDIKGIRWHQKRGEKFMSDHIWPMAFQTLVPLVNLFFAALLLLMALDDLLYRILKRK